MDIKYTSADWHYTFPTVVSSVLVSAGALHMLWNETSFFNPAHALQRKIVCGNVFAGFLAQFVLSAYWQMQYTPHENRVLEFMRDHTKKLSREQIYIDYHPSSIAHLSEKYEKGQRNKIDEILDLQNLKSNRDYGDYASLIIKDDRHGICPSEDIVNYTPLGHKLCI